MIGAEAHRSLLDRVRSRRDGYVADPGFRAWAASSPFTRWVARRQARKLFDLAAGFVYSQVLAACVELRLFDRLRGGPVDRTSLAASAGVPTEALRSLLDAAIALDLVRTLPGDRYALGSLGAAMVDNPAVTAMVEHHAVLYRDLADPVALLRSPRGSAGLAGYWPYAGARDPAAIPAEQVSAYTRLMALSQPLVTEDVLDALDPGRYRRLMDLGGGDGTFALAAARRAPALEVTVVDLPAVAERARSRFEAAGLGTRARAIGADFRRDPLPAGADLATLVRVLHDHDDEDARALLANLHAALAPGATVAVAEPMAGTPGAETVGAYFSLYLLAMGRGRPRSAAEIARLLGDAGFRGARRIATPMPLQAGLVVARR